MINNKLITAKDKEFLDKVKYTKIEEGKHKTFKHEINGNTFYVVVYYIDAYTYSYEFDIVFDMLDDAVIHTDSLSTVLLFLHRCFEICNSNYDWSEASDYILELIWQTISETGSTFTDMGSMLVDFNHFYVQENEHYFDVIRLVHGKKYIKHIIELLDDMYEYIFTLSPEHKPLDADCRLPKNTIEDGIFYTYNINGSIRHCSIEFLLNIKERYNLDFDIQKTLNFYKQDIIDYLTENYLS